MRDGNLADSLDGFGIQVLSDPEWDREAAFQLGVRTARRLLGAAG